MGKRKTIDLTLRIITYFASFISVIILGAIIIFIFSRGLNLLSFDIITSDYKDTSYLLHTIEDVEQNNFENPLIKDAYFSERYGIALIDGQTKAGLKTIKVVHISPNSPLLKLVDDNGNITSIKKGYIFDSTVRLIDDDNNNITHFSKDGAESLILGLDQAKAINNWMIKQEGGGLRGSIITTLYLIVVTLLIGMPIGILSALYIHEIASQNRFTNLVRSFIDMLTGVPSIIYGLMGAALFIPLTTRIFNDDSMKRGSLIAGALTLSVIILPVIIKTTESALDVVPKAYKEASLALGATKTQTTFKVMLPNAAPGILSAALLSIGRIVGESAALIYAMGTLIGDNVSLTGRSTSLSVHIWSAMSGEIPNIALASTMAIIILVVVLSLNLLVKLITYRFMKRYK